MIRVFETSIADKNVKVGIGIHDSSSSLAPYILGSEHPFILISTGTWCINMNPYNEDPLTAEQLEADCLCFLSVSQKPGEVIAFIHGTHSRSKFESVDRLFPTSFRCL